MPITHFPQSDNESNLDLYESLNLIHHKLGEMSVSQRTLIKEFDEMQDMVQEDHEELIKLLVTKEFFWKIIIKTGLPLLFLMFGIGWGIGKFAQHISTALGW